MNRLAVIAIRLSLLGVSLLIAFLVPRSVDPWYDLCPSLNCFPTGPTPYVVVALGLLLGVVLNVLASHFGLFRRRT